MKVRWTTPALRDLEAIGDFVAEDSPLAAVRLVERILDHAGMLGKQPHIGRPGRVGGTRELVVSETPFVVPYRVGPVSVEILAVFHGARRWPDRFD